MKLDLNTIRLALPPLVMTVNQQHYIGLQRARKAQPLQHPRRSLQPILADEQINVGIPPRILRCIQPASDGWTPQQHAHDPCLVQLLRHLARGRLQARASCRRFGPQPKINQALVHDRSTVTSPGAALADRPQSVEWLHQALAASGRKPSPIGCSSSWTTRHRSPGNRAPRLRGWGNSHPRGPIQRVGRGGGWSGRPNPPTSDHGPCTCPVGRFVEPYRELPDCLRASGNESAWLFRSNRSACNARRRVSAERPVMIGHRRGGARRREVAVPSVVLPLDRRVPSLICGMSNLLSRFGRAQGVHAPLGRSLVLLERSRALASRQRHRDVFGDLRLRQVLPETSIGSRLRRELYGHATIPAASAGSAAIGFCQGFTPTVDGGRFRRSPGTR